MIAVVLSESRSLEDDAEDAGEVLSSIVESWSCEKFDSDRLQVQ